MAEAMQDYAVTGGAKIIWAAANPVEASVKIMMDVPNPKFIQSYGLKQYFKKAQEDAGTDVELTTVITQIGDF